MRIAGSLPRLPQRLIVSVETRSRVATSETVKRSGRFARSIFFGVVSVLVSEFWFWLSIIFFVFCTA